MRRSGRRRACAYATFAVLASATILRAQTVPGGPWVPVGSLLDREVRWAVDAGALRLNPLVRPFRLAAVRTAVREAGSTTLSAQARRALNGVRERLRSIEDSTALVVEFALQGYTNARRETFRSGGGSGVGPALGVWGSYSAGPILAVINPAIDERLRDDPEFAGEKTTEITGRVQTAYVAVTGRYGDALFGRLTRNWGPGLFDGLLLSSVSYAFDELAGSLRLGRFELTSVAQRLSTVRDTGVPGVDYNRYFFAHRLDIRLGDDVWLGLVESGVYGGRGQSFELVLHSPLNLGLASQFNDSITVNSMLGADLAFRLAPGLRVEASGFLDDIQTDRSVLTDRRPTSYGATAVARFAFPDAPLHAALGYTRIASLSYRNSFGPPLEYSSHHVGLARNFSDYDQWLVRLAARPGDSWVVAADLAYFRQGAGDLRQPFPSDSVLATPGQGFLLAPVARFAAGRLMIDGEIRPGIQMSAELGFTRGTNGRIMTIAAVTGRIAVDVLHRRVGAGYPGVERGADRAWP